MCESEWEREREGREGRERGRERERERERERGREGGEMEKLFSIWSNTVLILLFVLAPVVWLSWQLSAGAQR